MSRHIYTAVKPTTRVSSCPVCQSLYLERVDRRLVDKMASMIVPVRRYYCESCGWKGNLKSNPK